MRVHEEAAARRAGPGGPPVPLPDAREPACPAAPAAMDARDGLVYEAYGCSVQPQRWSGLLDRVCQQVGAGSAVAQILRRERSGFRIEWAEQDSRTRRIYAQLPAIATGEWNPRLQLHRVAGKQHRLVRDADLFLPGDSGALQGLEDGLSRGGLDHFAGYLHQVSEDTFVALAFHRSTRDAADFSAAQLGALGGLAPHLAQAFGIGSRFLAGIGLTAAMQHLLDRLRCAISLGRADGRLLWSNRSAQALFGPHSALQLKDGCLRARHSADTDALLEAMAGAARESQPGPGRYLVLGAGAQAVHVAMRPLRMAAEAGGGGEPAALLIAATPVHPHPGVSSAAIRDLFGLTQAEGRLVEGLVAGLTLDEYAQRRGVSAGTVRGQVKQVFAKTGVTRQAELVRLVLSSVAAQLAAADGG